MQTEFELVIVQQSDSRSTTVMRELAALGSGFTLVQRNEPAPSRAAFDVIFTALARNEATERTSADWVVFLDAAVALHGRWLEQLQSDLYEADAVLAPVSVADEASPRDCGRRVDIAYRRDFVLEAGGFPVSADVSGQEDLLLGLRCLTLGRLILRGRRRSERLRGPFA